MKFEKFFVGQTHKTVPVIMTKEEIMSFAMQYDPQYFHINEEQAKQCHFGDVIASGFHTIGKVWAEWIKLGVLAEDCLGGLSANDISWKLPVYPGDYLHVDVEVTQKKIKNSGKMGIITLAFDVKNQNNKTVLTFLADVLIATGDSRT